MESARRNLSATLSSQSEVKDFKSSRLVVPSDEGRSSGVARAAVEYGGSNAPSLRPRPINNAPEEQPSYVR